MQGWLAHKIVPEVRARLVGELPPLAQALETEIDALWTRAQARTGGMLFNGGVFSVDAITPKLLSGHLTEFRRVVAQMERPDLYDVLRVRPLAVCGVVCCRDGVVLGRRPADAVYQPSPRCQPAATATSHGSEPSRQSWRCRRRANGSHQRLRYHVPER